MQEGPRTRSILVWRISPLAGLELNSTARGEEGDPLEKQTLNRRTVDSPRLYTRLHSSDGRVRDDTSTCSCPVFDFERRIHADLIGAKRAPEPALHRNST
jgi:hypothetical protein